MLYRDFLRAFCFTGRDVGATTEAFGIVLFHHANGALGGFHFALRHVRQVAHFSGSKEHRRCIRAGRYTGAAADTGSGVHRFVSYVFFDGNSVAVLRLAGIDGDISASLNDAVEGIAVNDEVLNDRKGRRAPGLDGDRITVIEVTHVQLAGSGALLRSVGVAIDDQTAGTTDAFAAIVLKGNGFLLFADDLFVEHVQHLQKGHVGGYAVERVRVEMTFGVRIFLPPDFKGELHVVSAHNFWFLNPALVRPFLAPASAPKKRLCRQKDRSRTGGELFVRTGF